MDTALKEAEAQNKASGDGTRGVSGFGQLSSMTDMLSSIPGGGDLAQQGKNLQMQSEAQQRDLESQTDRAGSNIPGTNIDPIKTAAQIYPILEFRDRVVKVISATIEKIPGLQALVEKITETLTLFILSLLAPFIRPIITAVSQQLKAGSGGVIDASGKHQYEPWTDPHCSDPTHSLLSKDHFSNILNEPAGQIAAAILQYVAPRIIYAWEHPDILVDQVLNDVVRVFHHPAMRDNHCEIHRDMFSTVERWLHSRPDGGSNLNTLLSSESVRQGKNHTVDAEHQSHSHGGLPSGLGLPGGMSLPSLPGGIGNFFGSGSQSKTRDGPWEQIGKSRELGMSGNPSAGNVAAQTHPPGAQQSYEQPGQWQQPYQGPPPSADPNFGGYGTQPTNPAYGGQPQYGFDPNAPAPPSQYSQSGYYGQPPPPGSYYGGSR